MPKLEEESLRPTKRTHMNTEGGGEGRAHQILQLVFQEKLLLRQLVLIKPKNGNKWDGKTLW